MARANKKGRPSRIPLIKVLVKKMRSKGLSFSEIGNQLGISKQLARYHSLVIHKHTFDKEMEKNRMEI